MLYSFSSSVKPCTSVKHDSKNLTQKVHVLFQHIPSEIRHFLSYLMMSAIIFTVVSLSEINISTRTENTCDYY